MAANRQLNGIPIAALVAALIVPGGLIALTIYIFARPSKADTNEPQ